MTILKVSRFGSDRVYYVLSGRCKQLKQVSWHFADSEDTQGEANAVAPTPWGTCPHFYKWLGTGGTVSRRTANKKLTTLY